VLWATQKEKKKVIKKKRGKDGKNELQGLSLPKMFKRRGLSP